jgi:glycosidase
MATAVFNVRVENNYGECMEFEYEYDFDGDVSDFDPADPELRDEIYQDVMHNMYYDMDFVRLDAE